MLIAFAGAISLKGDQIKVMNEISLNPQAVVVPGLAGTFVLVFDIPADLTVHFSDAHAHNIFMMELPLPAAGFNSVQGEIQPSPFHALQSI